MAIHNSVFLFGRVLVEPQILTNPDGEDVIAKFAISVIRNDTRKTGNENETIKYDSPIIISRNKELIQKIKELKKNDVIQLKGVLVTANTKKTRKCPHCDQKNIINGMSSFINPIYLKIIKQNNTPEEALRLIKESQEVSNVCTIIGTLCSDPEYYMSSKGTRIAQYQLAINRKYKIKEDAPEIRTDYPWVKSYDENAELDSTCLRQNSKVFIDGLIQSRSFTRKYTCEHCNEAFTWDDSILEITAYQTEYLSDFITPEEKEKMDANEAHNLANDLLG